MTPQKLCRICWNTRYWREPTGEAQKLEGPKSYVNNHGFGHEEWLFNFDWVQKTPTNENELVKYGFLQPIGKYRSAYEGKYLDLRLYTIDQRGNRLEVAVIREAYVPVLDELAVALRTMRERGWIDEMKEHLDDLGISSKPLNAKFAQEIINLRFRKQSVEFFEPMLLLPPDHKLYRINRYVPLDFDASANGLNANEIRIRSRRAAASALKSEADVVVAGHGEIVRSAVHSKIQNALYSYLSKKYGASCVSYEKDYVDLAVKSAAEVIFYEIKTANTVRSCIREAIGQLLDYAAYPHNRRAARLIVVSDVEPRSDDVAYLEHIRQKHRLNLYYQQWKGGVLENPI